MHVCVVVKLRVGQLRCTGLLRASYRKKSGALPRDTHLKSL